MKSLSLYSLMTVLRSLFAVSCTGAIECILRLDMVQPYSPTKASSSATHAQECEEQPALLR